MALAPLHCLYITVVVGPFESKVLYTLQLRRGDRGKCLTCLALMTPLYITLTMINVSYLYIIVV